MLIWLLTRPHGRIGNMEILIRAIFYIAFISPFVSHASPKCQNYIRGTWAVNLKRHELQRLHLQTQVEQFCAPLPQSGSENVTLQLFGNGKLLFERKINVSLETPYDYLDRKKAKGGVIAADKTTFTSHIPETFLSAKNHNKLILTLIDSNTLLARGAP